MTEKRKKVMLGMSGGVDSSAAAVLLKRQGFEVYGVTMRVYDTKNADAAERDAREVCRVLDIPHEIVDFRKEFQDTVIAYFKQSYQNGKTPNPCVFCNREIKFGRLFDFAMQQNMDAVATGHYASIWQDPQTLVYYLKRSQDAHKDQTYFLYTLGQERLSKILFPLANLQKQQAREFAQEAGLPIFAKKDSQEICFIEDNDYIRFLKDVCNLAMEPGDFVTKAGEKIGGHQGLFRYTVGQRKGLGQSFDKPMYVLGLDAGHNTVVLGENAELFCKTIRFHDAVFPSPGRLEDGTQVEAKIRYAAPPAPARIFAEDNGVYRLEFEEGQRAATPGQSVVLYLDDLVVGGGVIQ